jgi:mono/diheme cytochrome c family protein
LVLASLLGALVALLATGCSDSKPGGHVVTPTPTEVVGKLPPKPVAEAVSAIYAHGDAVAGKAVFTTAGCSACHTLAAAGATGTVGPNLDVAKPSLAKAVLRVTKGAGAMPPFKGNLSDKQIADVVAYVVKSTSG